MSKDVWMTSDGLDVMLEESPVKKQISVEYGDIKGAFVEVDSLKNKLTFRTSNIELAIGYIGNPPKAATITYSDVTHHLRWESNNYSIKKSTADTVLIVVENLHEK